jgi:hypothetical protein
MKKGRRVVQVKKPRVAASSFDGGTAVPETVVTIIKGDERSFVVAIRECPMGGAIPFRLLIEMKNSPGPNKPDKDLLIRIRRIRQSSKQWDTVFH